LPDEHSTIAAIYIHQQPASTIACMTKEITPAQYQLSAAQLAAMKELGFVLATLYQSLKQDGYRLENGKIIKPN